MPRNRELVMVFKPAGFVEQLGSGMSRILTKYDKSFFDISDNFIVVTIMFDDPMNDRINDRINLEILKILYWCLVTKSNYFLITYSLKYK